MLLRVDGFNDYSTTEIDENYTVNTTDCTYTIEATDGPSGGPCIKRVSTQANAACGYLQLQPLYVQSGVWSQQASGVFVIRLKVDDITASAGSIQNSLLPTGTILTIMNGSLANCSVALNSDGTFTFYRVLSALQTSLAAVVSGQWVELAFIWTLSQGSDGTFVILANGTQILSFTGRTSPIGSDMFPFQPPPAAYNTIRFLGMSSDSSPLLTVRAADMYFLDGVAPNNSYLGDLSIGYILPNGAGNSTQWTPSAGANWQCVDEVPPNGDTDYNATSTAGNLDLYTYQDITNDPVLVQVCNYVRKTGAEGASMAVTLRQGSTNYTGPTQAISSTSYGYVFQPYDTNPATGLPFTISEINNGQCGPKKVT
ncbi:MAG TPA: hypothetical protein VHL34_24855 [Rhizomicrobium sp.]|jgi:hypothetical protein|nr:hypothetical protein [Rhizomicrobium sp.]